MEQEKVQNRVEYKNFVIEETFGETAVMDLLAKFYTTQQTSQEYIS